MADPTVILDDEGEVVRMMNEEGNPKISCDGGSGLKRESGGR